MCYDASVIGHSHSTYPWGWDFNKAMHFAMVREERRADERRGLTLPFKSLSPALLTARIDLALPWIHPGHQQERMHKAHYSEHAYSRTCTHMNTHTQAQTHTVRKHRHVKVSIHTNAQTQCTLCAFR